MMMWVGLLALLERALAATDRGADFEGLVADATANEGDNGSVAGREGLICTGEVPEAKIVLVNGVDFEETGTTELYAGGTYYFLYYIDHSIAAAGEEMIMNDMVYVADRELVARLDCEKGVRAFSRGPCQPIHIDGHVWDVDSMRFHSLTGTIYESLSGGADAFQVWWELL